MATQPKSLDRILCSPRFPELESRREVVLLGSFGEGVNPLPQIPIDKLPIDKLI